MLARYEFCTRWDRDLPSIGFELSENIGRAIRMMHHLRIVAADRRSCRELRRLWVKARLLAVKTNVISRDAIPRERRSAPMARLSKLGEASGHDGEFLIVVWQEIRLFAIEPGFMVRTYDHPKHDVITRSRRM